MRLIRYLIIISMFLFCTNYGQHNNRHFGIKPDSLTEITVTGKVITETSDSTFYHNSYQLHTRYYLDEDNDGNADYHLNFGPYWYQPDSSTATRPNDGDEITVKGGKANMRFTSIETIIVYEINGEFWRDPYFANWNNLGQHNHYRRNMRNHHRGGYGFGWYHDSLSIDTLSGMAMVDTTFYMNHYYLDTNNDSNPDYILNFGPFWFEPESGAVRPSDGEDVVVVGGVFDNSERIPMVMVYELNGLIWRDSTLRGNHYGGGWINGSMTNTRNFHAPFDHLDNITIDSGWRGSGHGGHGGMMQDSLFCQLLEVFPENIPNKNQENIFAGYELHMYNSDGSNAMLSTDMMGGKKMRFNNSINYQFHYSESQLNFWNVNEEEIKVKYWDEDNQNWYTLNASVDTENNILNFEAEDVGNYFILTAQSSVTGINLVNSEIPEEFYLKQNYPNPFNPATKIEYSIPENSHVKIKVFNSIGEEIKVLVNSDQIKGTYIIDFSAKDLPSGIYYYQMMSGEYIQTRKMVIVK